MRTEVFISDAFNRDVSWITQEVVEDYAIALLRGVKATDRCVQRWARDEPLKMNLLNEMMLDARDDIRALQSELIEEFGIEHFIGKPKTREQHIRDLEIAIEDERDSKNKAALYKELREIRGWVSKAIEGSTSVTVNTIGNGSQIQFDRNNPREAERVVMSIFGAV